jgi:uncharacterized protein YqiB (DUF1249 family)
VVCITVCDRKASAMKRLCSTRDFWAIGKKSCVSDFEKYRLSVTEHTRGMCHIEVIKFKPGPALLNI